MGNGRFLVSTGYDGFVKLWDNDVTGVYEQLQEWNIREKVARELITPLPKLPKFCISACSKFIVVALGNCVLLKDVYGKTIKSFVNEKITGTAKTVFSSNGRTIFCCCHERQSVNMFIKAWRPYLDDDDEDRLITLWSGLLWNDKITFSNDNSMVAIHDRHLTKGTVWSIDTNHKCLSKELDFPKSTGLSFTPDDKYIVCSKWNGSTTLWSIAEGKFTNTTLHFLNNRNNKKYNNMVEEFSPNNRQVIVQDFHQGLDTHGRYVTSYLVK